MDKLEKALQKARQSRQSHLPYAAARPAPAPRYSQGKIPPSAIVQIDEAYLEHHRIIAHRTRSKEADIFRILRTQLLQAMSQSGFRTLGITSPNYGDGKTTVALNLAVSIALDLKQTVLLADLDLRKPNVTEYIGIEPACGLSDYFMEDVPIADCLLRLSFERLTILPAGRALENSSEMLGSPKMAALAHELRTRYDDRLIIYDMPPILAQDDPIAFLPHMDAVLLVVRDDVSKVSEIRQSMTILSGAHVIGTVLNHARDRKPKSPDLRDGGAA